MGVSGVASWVPSSDGEAASGAPSGCQHTVRFHSGQLAADELADWLGERIAAGGAAVVIADRQHLAALSRSLASRRLDLDLGEARASGRLIEREVRDALRSFMSGGAVDEVQFAAEIGGLVDRSARRFGAVAVYGEMVDVLAQAGDIEQAVALEQAWGRFLAGRPVTLRCGYAYQAFDRDLSGDGFAMVCDQHERVEGGRVEAEVHHKTRALDLVRERVARLANVTAALCDAATASAVAEVIATEMAAAVGADQAVLALPSQDETRLTLVGHSGLRPEALNEYGSFPISAPLPAAAAFTSGCPLWLSSPAAIEECFPEMRRAAIEAQAIACLPLEVRGRRLGAVGFGFRAPRAFLPPSRAFFEDMARQAALALDRAGLHERTDLARQRLQLLADASAHFSRATAEVDDVLDAMAGEVTRRLANCCTVSLRDDEGTRLRLAAIRHVDRSLEPGIREQLARAPEQLGAGPVGGVVASGQALVVAALGRGAGAWPIPRWEPPGSRRVTSLLVVPLRAWGQTIGALAVSREGRDPAFAREDQDLLQDLADRAALFVENARLYGRAQRERARAEQANRAKDEFLAMLGHELRNPLAPILTALELMRLRGGDTLVRERAIIERQVGHMTRLVDDLLDVSRVTRGRLILKRTGVELQEVVADALEMARPLVQQRTHTLQTALPSGLLVDADASRLAQAVANLLTNAATYTPPGGLIRVSGQVRDGQAELRVGDNGVGIDPALLPRVFDLFVQGPRAIDRAEGGLGLGLPIVRAIVELHGGTVSAHSEGRNQGCEIVIRLPLARAVPDAVDPVPAPPRPGPDGGLGRVLLVDDNRDAAESLAEALAELGYATRVVHDGAAALLAAGEFRPNIALLDIGLPLMDGYELAGLLRAQLGDAVPRIIAVTGYGLDADRARSEAAGFAAHLVKPIDLDQLESVISGTMPAATQQAAH